jgi:sulfite reductase beta subunit-like hemoprotein
MSSQRPIYPCTTVPESAAEARLLGLYPQRQEGWWMQRVKIPGGILTHEQWRALADSCRRFTPSAPLLLTTRQDMEFHNLTAEAIPRLQSELAHAGLTTVGACGDTLRNITLCPGNGLCRDAPDLTLAARALGSFLESFSGIYSLPRKFKISLSACSRACAQPWINDLGFVISREKGSLHVTAIGAGSLGPRPVTGMLLYENLPAQDICALSLAAIRVVDTHGNRENRGKARLRHVRERLGNEQFHELLDSELRAVKNETQPPALPVICPELNLTHALDLNPVCGMITPGHAEAIADLARSKDMVVRPQTHHRLSLFARDAAAARAAIEKNPYLKQLAHGPDIVSCPGTTYCSRALVNTHAMEKALREQMPADGQHAIRISGCPNGCAQSAVAGIGLTGKIKKDSGGSRVEGFSVATSGGMGKTPVLACPEIDFISAEHVPEFMRRLIDEQAGDYL